MIQLATPDLITTEVELIQRFKEAGERKELATRELDRAKTEYEALQAMLIELCEARGVIKTAEYDRLGHVTIVKPRIHANYSDATKEDLFRMIREIDRGDLIREIIYPASISGFVGETLDEIMTKEVPAEEKEKKLAILRVINYYAEATARLYSPKKGKKEIE